MLDKFRDECGIFGIKPHPESANMTYLGLYALQHRGQESTGITWCHQGQLQNFKSMGLVADAYSESKLREMEGKAAIGHVRYSTAGTSDIANAQPILITCQQGQISMAHNGNLVNANNLRKRLESLGSIFNSNSDTEVILHLIAKSSRTVLEEAVVDALKQVEGAYSCVFLAGDKLIAIRDPHGFRPLLMGSLGETTVFGSESCAFDLIGARFEREVEPGEMVVVTGQGMRRISKPFEAMPIRQCIFEHIYFARPDSFMFGESTHDFRHQLGVVLARESPVEADIVVPVPDSGVVAAIGYAHESKLPLAMGLIRNHYVGRTFIEPKQSIRHFGVKVKLNAVSSVIKGKRIILVDDSLVRGTTSRKIIKMLKASGAESVHVRITSPPTTHPCYYGIDTPTRSELIAHSHSIDEIRKYIEADSLTYITRDGMLSCLSHSKPEEYCHACFSGEYVIQFPGISGGLKV